MYIFVLKDTDLYLPRQQINLLLPYLLMIIIINRENNLALWEGLWFDLWNRIFLCHMRIEKFKNWPYNFLDLQENTYTLLKQTTQEMSLNTKRCTRMPNKTWTASIVEW